MRCPRCEIELNCGCRSCMKHSPDKPNKMISVNEEIEKCPGCGLEKHIEDWMYVEYEQYEKDKKDKDEITLT